MKKPTTVALAMTLFCVLTACGPTEPSASSKVRPKTTAEQIEALRLHAEFERAQRATRCSQREIVVAGAARLLKSNDADAALAALIECPELAEDADAKKLTAKARSLQKSNADKAAAADRVAMARGEAAERARRKREGVSIGMSQEEVVASSWGKPRKINRTTTARGTSEQWVYDGGYLYFDDGVLRSIQN